MYVEYYGLSGHPFQLTPDPGVFFGSSVHNRGKAHLTFGLSQGEGFVVVTGDVGAGKTTLIGHILDSLNQPDLRIAKIVTTALNADDLVRMVAAAFDLPAGEGAGKTTLLKTIQEFLEERHRDGERCVLVVDEVQNLPFGALEELRMLSNLAVDGHSSLQMVLVGQPEFKRTLGMPELEQLRQRVVASVHIAPLAEDEIEGYVRCRLDKAGWRGLPFLNHDLWPALFEHTDGVPRRINILCSRLLIHGFLEERRRLDAQDVAVVAEDLRAETEAVTEGLVIGAEADGADTDTGMTLTLADEIGGLVVDLGDRVAALEDKMGKLDRLIAAARRLDRSSPAPRPKEPQRAPVTASAHPPPPPAEPTPEPAEAVAAGAAKPANGGAFAGPPVGRPSRPLERFLFFGRGGRGARP